ncbi:hypothetical protein K9U09_23350 (plasmid) [Escherichia coli]|nr:hypothetical protein K9U09_23350 [Escherichia coli]
MGNYSDFETDFVQRTLALIDQYNEMIEVLGKPFREQYNYTLTLNCLLGLIVLPKERALSFLPADRLTRQLKAEMGLHESQLPGPEMNLRELIHKLRIFLSLRTALHPVSTACSASYSCPWHYMLCCISGL